MKEFYEEVSSAAENMDCDELEAIFSEMENYRIPDSDKEHYSKIKKLASNFKYEAIVEIIKIGADAWKR